MLNLWHITMNILKRMMKKPASMLLHFAMPVAAAVALFFIMGLAEESHISVGYVDQDHTDLSAAYIDALSETSTYELTSIKTYNMDKALESGQVQLIVKLQSGFEDQLITGQAPQVVIYSAADTNLAQWVKVQSDMYINTMVKLLKTTPPQHITQAMDRQQFQVESLDDEAKDKQRLSSVFGIYLLLILITTNTVSFKILNEKEMGTYNRIGNAPVHPRIYTFANILASFLLVIIQVLLVLLVLKFGLGVSFYTSIFNIAVVLNVFAICGISLGILIAVTSSSIQSANGIIGLLLAPSSMLAGCMWPIEYMPELLQKAAYITPQRWTLDALHDVMRFNSLSAALPELLIVIGFTVVFFLVSVYHQVNAEKV